MNTNTNNITTLQAQNTTNVNTIAALTGNINTNNIDIIGLKIHQLLYFKY